MSHWLTLYDPDDGEPFGTVCRCPIGRDHDGSEVPSNSALVMLDGPGLPDGPVTDAVEALAVLLSKRRTHGSVFMDGSHNPLPSEMIDAHRFVEDLCANGWAPYGVRLAALLDRALDLVESQGQGPSADAFVARARRSLESWMGQGGPGADA